MHLSQKWLRNTIGICAMFMITIVSYIALPATAAQARPVQPRFNHFLYNNPDGDAIYDDNEQSAAQEQYDNRALPKSYISSNQVNAAYDAHTKITQQPVPTQALAQYRQQWQLVGPSTTNVSPEATYTGRSTVTSGRTVAIAIARTCTQQSCRAWIAAAGGGVWRTENALADKPEWTATSNGLRSNAFGSLIIDPTDRTGRTLYAGTGEPNGSSDSEAGVGLFKSTDGGNHWQVVPGSLAAAQDRAIGGIAVDPTNPKHIFIGTMVARHGAAAVNGGRFTPPGAPVIGLYESTNGGQSFKLVFSRESDIVDPGTPNGNDFFRGGVTHIEYYTGGKTPQLYFSVSDYGLYRSANGSFEQVFTTVAPGSIANSPTDRTEFALAPYGDQLRIYLANAGSGTAEFYRTDNAHQPAKSLTDGKTNPGWIKLSDADKTKPGFASYNFCTQQCSYDMFVASPPGQPNVVWIGGSMIYDEIFTPNPPSNGRTVQRSTDAGVSFTDMTNDAQQPPLGMHPDQHAIAFLPGKADTAIIGSDGGVVRTSGQFTDGSGDCANRGLSGTELTNCQRWLKVIPTKITSLNAGLATLQYQSVSVNPKNPRNDLIGGTQDNGTHAITSDPRVWTVTVGGDGGQSVIDTGNPNIRMHTYYGPNGDVNFRGNDPRGWNYWADPLVASKERASFYVPLIGDPKVSQTMFVGLEHVWRTKDSGGPQDYLEKHCNQITGDFQSPCGDWITVGPNLTDTTFGADKAGDYVVALQRASNDTHTLWTATRRGRLFISTNADASPENVSFTRLDTSAQPNRFISGIAVDPKDAFHAYVSFAGYSAYTPQTPGHVFDVHYNPTTQKATWKDVSYNIGDQPITGIAYDNVKGTLYVATDFGVNQLAQGGRAWRIAGSGLPTVAVYSLTISTSGRVLYAATHGRSVWKTDLR